jgi:hypothetical protein
VTDLGSSICEGTPPSKCCGISGPLEALRPSPGQCPPRSGCLPPAERVVHEPGEGQILTTSGQRSTGTREGTAGVGRSGGSHAQRTGSQCRLQSAHANTRPRRSLPRISGTSRSSVVSLTAQVSTLDHEDPTTTRSPGYAQRAGWGSVVGATTVLRHQELSATLDAKGRPSRGPTSPPAVQERATSRSLSKPGPPASNGVARCSGSERLP